MTKAVAGRCCFVTSRACCCCHRCRFHCLNSRGKTASVRVLETPLPLLLLLLLVVAVVLVLA